MKPHALDLFTTRQLLGLYEAAYADVNGIYTRVEGLQAAQLKMPTWIREYKALTARIGILLAAGREIHELMREINAEIDRRHADARQYTA